MAALTPSLRDCLPDDPAAVLVGRIWDPETGGPRVVHVRGEEVVDITSAARSIADLLDDPDPVGVATRTNAGRAWHLDELTPDQSPRPSLPGPLAPVDVQALKACGVTFARSMIERAIEESAGGDSARAAAVRARVGAVLEGRLDALVPGSEAAARIRETLTAEGMWSQYLEVGIGPDPEVFTKAPVLSALGWGTTVGIAAASRWSNPEPELVLIADARGRARGVTLGNDVNLRDVEGRSALLLGMAKDNNGSAAVGPFVRLLDAHFTLDRLRSTTLRLRIDGRDGFHLDETADLAGMSRRFEDLVAAAWGRHHQYPDGFALFTGTPFAPSQDRGEPGMGFTHHTGDMVRIDCPHLGSLVNTTGTSEDLPPWEYGFRQLALAWERTSDPGGAR